MDTIPTPAQFVISVLPAMLVIFGLFGSAMYVIFKRL